MTKIAATAQNCAALFAALLASRALLAQQPPMPVGVTDVVERDVPASIRLVGTVKAEREAVIAAEVSGLVIDFPASEGQFLKKGESICALDATPAALRVDEAQAELDRLSAQLEELENGTRPEVLRELAAQVEEAQAMYEKWDYERRRVADLAERAQSSDKELHDTEMEYLAARERLSRAQAAHEAAVNGPRKEELARARYAVAAQRAVTERLRRDFEKTKICAPFDGFVVAKRTEIGEWIDEGGAVCDMIALETVKVRADVPESAVVFARVGAPATVYFEALDKSYNATITRLIPRAEQAARTFPVEIDLPNPEHVLLAGMFAWTYVPAGPTGRRLMVHKDAVVARGLSKQVFVIRPGPGDTKMAIPMPITTGLELGTEVEIQGAGIQAGDQVVDRANERLYGPTPVMPMPAGAPSATTQPGPPPAGKNPAASP